MRRRFGVLVAAALIVGGCSDVSTTSPVRDLQVAEIRAVIIDNDP